MIYSNGPKTARFTERKKPRGYLAVPASQAPDGDLRICLHTHLAAPAQTFVWHSFADHRPLLRGSIPVTSLRRFQIADLLRPADLLILLLPSLMPVNDPRLTLPATCVPRSAIFSPSGGASRRGALYSAFPAFVSSASAWLFSAPLLRTRSGRAIRATHKFMRREAEVTRKPLRVSTSF